MSKINKKGFKGVESVKIDDSLKEKENAQVINLKLQKIIEKQKKLEDSFKNLIKETPNVDSLMESLVKGYKEGIEETLNAELNTDLPKLQIAAFNKNKIIKK